MSELAKAELRAADADVMIADEMGDDDLAFAMLWREIVRLRKIEVAAVDLLAALGDDEEWDHLICEQRTIAAHSALGVAVHPKP